MASAEIVYRKLETHEEFQACERLQQETWGFADLAVVPNHILIAFQKHGGIVLGAFDRERLVGFAYGFVGLDDLAGAAEPLPTEARLTRPGRGTSAALVKHTSVMLAVRPEYRGRGIATRLKLEQRRLAQQQGFSLMTWTFDPLQAANAHFNLNKLGAIARRYERDLYGKFRDELNRGLPTDRFTVEWWLDSPHVERRLAAPRAGTGPLPEPANPPRRRADGLWAPAAHKPKIPEGDALSLAIPLEIDALKARDRELALAWRGHTRAWFEAAFAAGFLLAAFDRDRGLGAYTLVRAAREDFLAGKTHQA